jgi:hypothetical protein
LQISCKTSQVILFEANEGTTAFAGGMTVPRDVSPHGNTLTSWLKRHCAVLQWACVNAFELKDHPEKGLDHVFLIQLEAVVHPTSKGQAAVKPWLQINSASLVNHIHLFGKYPGVVAMFVQQKESDDIWGKVEGTVSYNMLVQYGVKWQLQQMILDQEEFDGLEKRKDWVDVLLSITKGMKEFKMVNGNPVRQ